MNNTELAKHVLTKELKVDRDSITPGEYQIDEILMFHVKGNVKVGEDFEAKVPNKIDTWKLLAVAFNKLNGVTLDLILSEYMANGLDDQAKELKDVIQTKIEALKESTKQTNKGKITVKAIVETIEKPSR